MNHEEEGPGVITVEAKLREDKVWPVDVEPVGEHFGVHDQGHGGAEQSATRPSWQVLHLPSGHVAAPERFWTHAGAVAWVQKVAGLADWSTPVPTPAGGVNLRHALQQAQYDAAPADLAAYCDQERPAWPVEHSQVTAADLAGHYAVRAVFASHRAMAAAGLSAADLEPLSGRASAVPALAFVDVWAVAYLLRALHERAPDAADEIAADLWAALEAGDTLHEEAWAWLVGARIDPGAVWRDFVAAEAARRADEETKVDRLTAVVRATTHPYETPAGDSTGCQHLSNPEEPDWLVCGELPDAAVHQTVDVVLRQDSGPA